VAGGAGATLATWPAVTVTLPLAAAARVESIVARYAPGSRSTNPNQPDPSVVRCAMTVLLPSYSVTCAAAMGAPPGSAAIPRSCPSDGVSFHGIAGAATGLAKIAGVTGSSALGWVSAVMSSARADAPVRVPAFVAASGVRYEYPFHPADGAPTVLFATAVRS